MWGIDRVILIIDAVIKLRSIIMAYGYFKSDAMRGYLWGIDRVILIIVAII